MGYVKHVQTEVEAGGVVTVHLPELKEGQKVEITVVADEPSKPSSERELGWLKGKIHIMPGFHDPIEF